VIAAVFQIYVFAARWARLRIKLHIESPTEYLAARYSVSAQQLMAWCGVLLKLFDVGAKWAALGVLLHGFTGLPLATGILLSGCISLLYVTVGGLWADLYTNLAQFLMQLIACSVLLFMVIQHLGGPGSILGIWARLPEANSKLFNGPYTVWFFLGYNLGNVFNGAGGTWNIATRFISAPTGKSARKSALLCAALYAVWPLVMFFPMWAGPLLVPNLSDPTQLYPILVLRFLPIGLVGLSLAAMFAATMSMTTSDTNSISAVITRDILPRLSGHFRGMNQKQSLVVARWSTFTFTALTLIIALESDHFGGVIGLIVAWFGALIGPISIPMVCGLLPIFRHADGSAAIGSIVTGVAVFAVAVCMNASLTARVTAPVCGSLAVFCLMAWRKRHTPVPEHIRDLLVALSPESEMASS
jgi:SSS family solute:Na+ symporter